MWGPASQKVGRGPSAVGEASDAPEMLKSRKSRKYWKWVLGIWLKLQYRWIVRSKLVNNLNWSIIWTDAGIWCTDYLSLTRLKHLIVFHIDVVVMGQRRRWFWIFTRAEIKPWGLLNAVPIKWRRMFAENQFYFFISQFDRVELVLARKGKKPAF